MANYTQLQRLLFFYDNTTSMYVFKNLDAFSFNILQVATISDREPEVPCLGLSWAHLGRTRMRVTKVPKQVKHDDKLLTVRKLEILYSPDTPIEYAEFLITEAGVIDVP